METEPDSEKSPKEDDCVS